MVHFCSSCALNGAAREPFPHLRWEKSGGRILFNREHEHQAKLETQNEAADGQPREAFHGYTLHTSRILFLNLA